jgi:hypothetical protein
MTRSQSRALGADIRAALLPVAKNDHTIVSANDFRKRKNSPVRLFVKPYSSFTAIGIR